jgi:hypothetical protein
MDWDVGYPDLDRAAMRVGRLLVVLYVVLIAFLAYRDLGVEIPELRQATKPSTWNAVDGLREMDADVLAAVAKVEDPEAGAAVMWTVLNRAHSSRTSVLEEASRPGAYGPWLGRRWRHPLDRAQLATLRALALRVLAGLVPDPTDGSTHFHRACTPSPPWASRRWRDFGSHHFYKEKRT